MQRVSKAVDLSVVVPVYGCRECLHALHERLSTVLSSITPRYELVLVDDRSPDGAWDTLCEVAARDAHTVALRLSRNFGQHAAITAGLERARGRWLVVMDCDLQDPPEEIPRLYAKAAEGYDIVYTQRKRTGTSLLRRGAARLYFKAMNIIARASLVQDQSGSLSIISRKVADEFLRFRDRRRHYLLILHWLGFNSASIEYEQRKRHSGSSSYRVRGLLGIALDGVLFQTTVLLRWIIYLGFLLALVGLAFAAYVFVATMTGGFLPGWASLAVFTLTIGGFIIISTGITGLYIGRIFEQVRERPLYVVDQVAGDVGEQSATATAERELAF